MLKTRNIQWELKSIGEDGEFEGWASVYGVVDTYNDIVERGAFTETLRQQPEVVLLNQHDPKQPIGVGKLIDTSYGLKISGRINLDTRVGREVYSNLKKRILKGLSIGYEVVKDAYDSLRKARILKAIRLHEVSVVTFAACPGAEVLGVKATATPGECMDALCAVKSAMGCGDPYERAIKAAKDNCALLEKIAAEIRADVPRYYYKEVWPDAVPGYTRQVAAAQLADARQRLDLPMIELRWFVPCTQSEATFSESADVGGQVQRLDPSTIWVRGDLSSTEVMRTVAHEAHHLAQFRKGGSVNHQEWERGAQEFEAASAP